MARVGRILITAGVVVVVALSSCAGARALTLGVNVHPEEDLSAAEVYNLADATTVLNQMQDAGVQMVRLFIPWMWIQPDGPDDYDQTYLSALTNYVAAVRQRKMELDLDLVGTPCWDTSDTAVSCVNGAYGASDTGANWAPTDDNEAGAIAAYLATHFSPTAIEVWNEPESPQYFMPPTGQDAALAYTDLTKAVDTAVKAAAPATTVVAGVLAQGDTDFLQQLYNDGIGPYADAISVHPYNITFTSPYESWGDPDTPIPGDPVASFLTAVPAVHQVMVDNGDANTPLWVTEFGFSSCDASVLCLDEQTAADYLAESIHQLESWPYVSVALVDESWDADGDLNDWTGFGLLRHDFTRRPSFCVLAETTGAMASCSADPLSGPAAAQDDLTRAWVLAREYAQANDDSFSGFDAGALSDADSSFSGDDLSTSDEAPGPDVDPKLIGIEVTGGGSGITLCNASSVSAYCVVDTTTSSAATVSHGEAPAGVWAAEAAVQDGDSSTWTIPGLATQISLSESPASLAANGSSTATLTATVTDDAGDPVSGDAVSFSSSDPAEQISPSVETGEGTYTATLTSSTTPGTVTLSATDTSVTPALTATTQLAQTATGSSPPAPTPTTTTTTTTTTTPTSTAPAPNPPVITPPSGVGSSAPLPRFTRSTPRITLEDAHLRLTGARTISLALHNANAFPVALTRLILWDGRVTLARAGGCRQLAAGATCRLTITLSAAQARALGRQRRVVLALALSALAPAGDSASGVDRATLSLTTKSRRR